MRLWSARPRWLPYAVAVLAVVASIVVKFAFQPWIPVGTESPFLLGGAAIMLAAWFGGLWPGLLATVFSAITITFFFMEPVYSFRIFRLVDAIRLLLYLGEGTLISLLAAGLHRTRARAESAVHALAESERHLRATFEQAATGIAQVGLDHRFLRINQRYGEILGRDRHQLLGDSFWQILHPDDVPAEKQRLDDLLQNRHTRFSVEKRYLHADGHPVWVNVTTSLIRDDAGQPLYFLRVVEDVSARKAAEDEVKRLNEYLERRVQERTAQLEEANRELESFSYSVSHDLRAPLRHIDGFTQLLTKHIEVFLDDRGRHLLRTIAQTAKTAGNLIDELLAFSRMGRAEMRQTVVDIAQIIQETRRELEPETADRRIAWTVGSFPPVQADPAMLRLVWRNLLQNAVKFTRHRAGAAIDVGSREEDGQVVFWVRDNGAGFDMRYIDKLFGVFQRLHRTEEFEGTGIGLANVRRIIHRHGGRVWAQGQVGQGATFYFSLPPYKG